MIVRLIAVVLRLSSLIFLGWAIHLTGAYQFAFVSGEALLIGPFIIILAYLLIAGALWFFPKRLAPIFYPYEVQDDVPINLDVDRLEAVIVQIIGLILILFGVHRILMALLNVLVATVDHGFVLDGATVFLNLTRGVLVGLLGLILLVRFRGVLDWLRRLRRAGAS